MANFLKSQVSCVKDVRRVMTGRGISSKILPTARHSQSLTAQAVKLIDKGKQEACSMSNEKAREVHSPTGTLNHIRYKICQDCSKINKPTINYEDQKMAEELRSLQPCNEPQRCYRRSELEKLRN